ncbi:MAG: hypothetical protein ABSF43_03745 [Rectinemataceae bacterium]|jgi:hypothetical protein
MKPHKLISKALPRHRMPESRIRPLAVGLTRVLGGAYLRFVLRVHGLEYRHPERLVEAWRDHQAGRTRLILAFRHAYGEEPQLLSRVFSLLPRIARGMGAPLLGPTLARFVHGYELVLWCDAFTRWIIPRSGAVPVYHVKFDKPSVERILAILREGPNPLALAPEGQVSYRSEALPRIERGALRLGFWCAEELRAAGRAERVVVLPISVHYRFDEGGIGKIEALVARLEADLGLPLRPSAVGLGRDERRAALLSRLEAADLALISAAEVYYGIPASAASRDERLDALLETALSRAEATFGLRPEGDRITRVYRIRQEGWDRIYPESGLPQDESLARRLADRRAGEARYVMQHMEFVDLCHYLDSAYPRGGESISFDRLVETAYSAVDFASRITGGNISDRPSVIARRALVSIAPPIDLTERYAQYANDRKGAMDSALSALEKSYMDSIKEHIDERSNR